MNLKKSLLHFALVILIGTSCQQNNQPSPTNNNNNNGGNTTSQSWVPATPYASPNGPVYSMAVYNSELYICGGFTQVGGIVANSGLAKWNGTSWTALPSAGYTFYSAGGNPSPKLFVYNNTLLVSVPFKSINAPMKRWTGSTWVSTGIYGVKSLCENNGQLLVSGDLDTTGSGSTTMGSVATCGPNFNWTFLPNCNQGENVCVYNNEIYCGKNAVKKWNGSSWIDITGTVAAPPMVLFLTVFNNKLLVGGDINSIGGITSYDLVQYDGAQWSSVSFQNSFQTNWVGDFVLSYLDGGNAYFRVAPGYYTGSVYHSILRWDGTQWVGVGNSSLAGAVYCMVKYNNELYIGGTQLTGIGQINLLKLN